MKEHTDIKIEADSDEPVISKILAGQKNLFDVIMRKYNSHLYRICMSIIDNASEAEDIIQTTYIKAYEHLSQFKKKSMFSTWLMKILVNESFLQLKKKKYIMLKDAAGMTKIINEQAVSTAAPLTLMNKETAHILEDALSRLSEKYRLVFVLREIENLSIAETMEVLQISEANVKVRLNRARTMLREKLLSKYKLDSIYPFDLVHCNRIRKNVFSYIKLK